jgi:hypothetical protein
MACEKKFAVNTDLEKELMEIERHHNLSEEPWTLKTLFYTF